MTPLKAGTRVRCLRYGAPTFGTVVRHDTPGIVWVRWDGDTKDSWMHLVSLTVIK